MTPTKIPPHIAALSRAFVRAEIRYDMARRARNEVMERYRIACSECGSEHYAPAQEIFHADSTARRLRKLRDSALGKLSRAIDRHVGGP